MQVYNEHVHMYTEMLVDWEAWGLAGSKKTPNSQRLSKPRWAPKGMPTKARIKVCFFIAGNSMKLTWDPDGHR